MVGGHAVDVRIASGVDELRQAFRLLADRYRAKGYEASDSGPYRITPHQALPSSITVVAKAGDRVIATLSMVPDHPTLGLPLEAIYPEEVAALRGEGRTLAEVTSLANVGLTAREFLPILLAMIRLVHQHHERVGGDSWVITVNPRHGAFYRKVLGFTRIGECRPHPAVQGAPAEAYLIDRSMIETKTLERLDAILDEGRPPSRAEWSDQPRQRPRTFLAARSLGIDSESSVAGPKSTMTPCPVCEHN